MSSYSKKRAADDSDDDQKVSVKTSKKTKHGISADGEDDEGNPFWEVCKLILFVLFFLSFFLKKKERENIPLFDHVKSSLELMFLPVAVKQASYWSIRIQRHESCQRPGVLRERRQNASNKEGTQIKYSQNESIREF